MAASRRASPLQSGAVALGDRARRGGGVGVAAYPLLQALAAGTCVVGPSLYLPYLLEGDPLAKGQCPVVFYWGARETKTRVVFVLGLVSLVNSLTAGKNRFRGTGIGRLELCGAPRRRAVARLWMSPAASDSLGGDLRRRAAELRRLGQLADAVRTAEHTSSGRASAQAVPAMSYVGELVDGRMVTCGTHRILGHASHV